MQLYFSAISNVIIATENGLGGIRQFSIVGCKLKYESVPCISRAWRPYIKIKCNFRTIELCFLLAIIVGCPNVTISRVALLAKTCMVSIAAFFAIDPIY